MKVKSGNYKFVNIKLERLVHTVNKNFRHQERVDSHGLHDNHFENHTTVWLSP